MHRFFAEKRAENLLYLAKEDIKHFKDVLRIKDDEEVEVYLDGAGYISSQWDGYLEKGSYAETEKWLEAKGIDRQHIHTSGHASPKDLQRFADALNPQALVPIHSFATEKYSGLFKNVVYRQDGEWWEV